MNTDFATIYNCFLGKITDDMYMELTPEDTVKDLQSLLLNSIPGFEFPRKCLTDYTLQVDYIYANEITQDDFVIGILWDELEGDNNEEEENPRYIVEKSHFETELTSEEINILACLMKQAWVQRQVTSIENIRMKYSGSDFKMTSQANHLAKLLVLLDECRRDSHHMQRLYKRRKIDENGVYQSNWASLRETNVFE